MRTPAATALLLLLLALPLGAQQPLVERIEVRIVNLDLVVTDGKNPVKGLKREDFELTVDGEKREITNFQEVRAEDAPDQDAASSREPPARRRFIFFIDEYSIHPHRRAMILGSLEKFLAKNRREGDEAMIVTWDYAPRIVSLFTSDAAALERAFDMLKKRAGGGAHLAARSMLRRSIHDLERAGETGLYRWGEAYNRATRQIEHYARQVLDITGALLDSLSAVGAATTGLDGKKVLVFAGEHLPQKPGAEFYQLAYDLFDPHMPGLSMMQAMSGAFGSNQRKKLTDVAEELSRSGVTLYALETSDPREFAETSERIFNETASVFAKETNTITSLDMLASTTGGNVVRAAATPDAALEKVAVDLASYYSIAYKGGGDGRPRSHRVVVTTKNRRLHVRTRRADATRSSGEEVEARVIANLLSETVPSDWRVDAVAKPAVTEGKKRTVTVEITLADGVTLLPTEKDLSGRFTILMASSAGGEFSPVTRLPRAVSLPASGEIRSAPIRFNATFEVHPGRNILSIGVMDLSDNSLGLARTVVDLEEAPPK